ncbi:MAG: peptidoglycan-binding protein [Pseudomonadaceae bacterium]|nr:peptidoglycan-binding protein [Pseudomonadaceae bacterium]
MLKRVLLSGLLIVVLLPLAAHADKLTEIIQKDLTALGYEPGNTKGEMTTATAIAISKFQAENSLEVTGEPSPQLAGVIKSRIKGGAAPANSGGVAKAAPAPAPAPTNDPAALQAAQQACLQQKVADAQASQKKKRGFGSLMRAVSRTASRLGSELAGDIARTSRDIYDVNATADDLESAAKDLGLTQDDVEDCRNP